MLKPEEHFRIISETASDAIVTIDEASTILFANPAASALFGYAPDEMIGKPLSMLMPERMRARHFAGVKRHSETGVRSLDWHSIELPGLHSSGREIDLEISFGSYNDDGRHYYTGIMRDVTERKQVARRLAAEQAVLQILAVSNDEASARAQLLDVLGTRFGWAFGAMWQVDEQENRLRCTDTWAQPNHPCHEFAAATQSAELGSGVGVPGRVWQSAQPVQVVDLHLEQNFPRRNSALRCLLRSALAFPVKHGGRVLGVIEFYGERTLQQDPSLLAAMDTVGTVIGQFLENRRTFEELQRANRVKTEFLATMSHELRTPLNAIIGYSQLLQEGIPAPIPPPAQDKVSRIERSARHLLGLIEEILSFSRLEAGSESIRYEDLDARDLVREVGAIVEPLAHEKGLDFRTDVPDAALPMRTDGVKVRQILVNLLGNAIKFTESGGVLLRVRPRNGYITFAVRDTGPGIPAEFQERIFEPFWQADSGRTRRAGGTGLGLSVTRRLARLLGGDVEVESEVGKGSLFRVRVPRAARARHHEEESHG